MSWPPLGVQTNAIHNRSSQLYSIKFASLPKYNKKLLGHWLVLLCHSSWVGRWQAVYEECKWPATLQNTSVRTINPQSRRPSQAAPWERLLYLCADFVVYALEEDFAQHVDRHLRHCYSCDRSSSHCTLPAWIMSEMEQTRLDVSAEGPRSPSPSVRRTVTYKASDLAFTSKGNDITIQHISEAKGYLNEFEQMYRKHRAEIDSLKRDHSSEVGAPRSCTYYRYACVLYSRNS